MIVHKLCSVRPLFTLQSIRGSRASYVTIPSEAVVIANDGTVVCWHPEQPFPYKYTKPLPIQQAENNSLLSNKAKEAMSVFRKQKPEAIRQELSQITFTTKHRWYPRARDKKAKNTPPDREYL